MKKEINEQKITCDRCGREEFIGEIIISSEWKPVRIDGIDLCFKCMESFLDWMKEDESRLKPNV